MEVGKNKLFRRQPFQLLLSKLSNSPNKHKSAGSATAGWPGSFVWDTTHPNPNPVAQPCQVIPSPRPSKGVCSPTRHCSCSTPSSAITDASQAASWDITPVMTGGHLSLQRWTTPWLRSSVAHCSVLLGLSKQQGIAVEMPFASSREAGLTHRCHG